MSTYNYVVTAHKPTNVTHSCVGNFTGPQELNLITAKCTRVEIHLLTPQGLQAATMEGLKVSDAELVVYLHPSKSKNVSQAIFGELSSMLFKFNDTFDGVLLAYSASTKNELAKILPGLNPYFGVRLQARLLLFYPKPGMLIEGKVVKLGEQTIHTIVLGFSSATIIEEDIRDEFSYKVKHGKEVYASSFNRHHKIEIGTIIRFVVKSFDEETLHISGSLAPPHTGSISWLDKPAEGSSNTKKRKGYEMENEDSLSLKDDKKKSKKHISDSLR